MNALQLCRWKFSHKSTLQQTFFKWSAILDRNRPFCDFEAPLGGLGATYDDHLRLIGKRVLDFLLVLINWTFLTPCYGWGIRANIGDFAPIGAGWPKISGRWGCPHPLFFFSENWAKLPFVWYKNLDRSFFRFVTMQPFDRRTVFSWLDRVCIPCSAVKTSIFSSANFTEGNIVQKNVPTESATKRKYEIIYSMSAYE